jgi:aryl-alcohol dehydrogenase-like predicted oxidoreductase
MAGLKGLGLDHADMLLLGHWQKRPPGRILDMAVKLRERGLFRHIAISTHTRRLAAELANEPASPFDIVQIRYNASHRGAEAEVFPRLPSEGCPGVIAFTATGPRKLLRRPWGLPASDPTPTSTDCYRFVLSNPRVDLCVAGPKNRAHLDLALAALDKGPLSESEMAWMRRVGDLVHRKLPI